MLNNKIEKIKDAAILALADMAERNVISGLLTKNACSSNIFFILKNKNPDINGDTYKVMCKFGDVKNNPVYLELKFNKSYQFTACGGCYECDCLFDNNSDLYYFLHNIDIGYELIYTDGTLGSKLEANRFVNSLQSDKEKINKFINFENKQSSEQHINKNIKVTEFER